jgi:3-oxoacyl-[acyl-carrier protein] reductase
MILEGKVAIVTGAGRGIGAAIARVLAREGATVAVNYAHSQDKAEAVVAEILANGGRAQTFAADVRNASDVNNMVDAVHQAFGRIDGLVNNSIAGRQHGAFADATQDDFDNAFDFGCTAVVNTTRAVQPIMKAQGGGRIINIVTELWNLAPAQWSVYMAGKGAMVGLSRSLACELGPDNITVNMVAPGWMVDEKVDTASDASKNFAASLPLRTHGSADEIGNACVFYLSHLAGYVTGTYLPVTGGRITQVGC